MASSERTEASGATPTAAAAPRASETAPAASGAGQAHREAGQANSTRDSSGPMAAPAIESAIISCLTNAQYHSCREAFLDTVHRWFMFAVIALGAAALTDALPKVLLTLSGITVDPSVLKEVFAAGAAILAALDLTFDLSNRARAHAMMKRRYYELLASMREGHKTPDHVQVCLEQFSADEEPLYRVLFLACWNSAQQSVYGDKALRFKISAVGNLFKNWFRRPSASYPVIGG
jgi:hypothetical protein